MGRKAISRRRFRATINLTQAAEVDPPGVQGVLAVDGNSEVNTGQSGYMVGEFTMDSDVPLWG